jgi:hypothetical protein
MNTMGGVIASLKRGRSIVICGGIVAAAVGIGVVSAGWRAPDKTESTAAPARLPVAVVYKDPNCGCCRTWVDRMKAAGFSVEIHDVASAAQREELKRTQGVTPSLEACHTAIVGGYVVEGHVPPELVVQMLNEHPKIAGLAVPGMPAGSPGMEGMGSEHYDVVAFNADGTTRVYAKR